MPIIHENYGRDLDLNLLRVFVVVASTGSVTQAAGALYLTQPAVSAALRRLANAIGAPLFARSGRGLALTQRGRQLLARSRPLLAALVDAALVSPTFDPTTSTRVLRLGLSDAMEGWLLPQLVRTLGETAPHMRLITIPVQFRSVADALTHGSVDLAITVADDLPATIHREPVLRSGFVCLYDPTHLKLKSRLTERDYFNQEHIIVSYNGDLRGIIEDMFHKQRKIRCSVFSFSHIATLVEGSRLVATVPTIVARHLLSLHPTLRTTEVPLPIRGSALELLWPQAAHDDEAAAFLRSQVRAVCQRFQAQIEKHGAKKPAREIPNRRRTRQTRVF